LEEKLNLTLGTIGGETFFSSMDIYLSIFLKVLYIGFLVLRLLIEGSGKTWKQDQKIRLQHIDTGGYLHSHDKKYSRIAGGQQEVRNRLEHENLLFSFQQYFVKLQMCQLYFSMLTAFSMFFIWIPSLILILLAWV